MPRTIASTALPPSPLNVQLTLSGGKVIMSTTPRGAPGTAPKQSRPRLLVLASSITCLHPEIPRDITFIIPSILRGVQRWWAS